MVSCAVAALLAVICLGGCSFIDLRSFGPAGAAPIPRERLFDLGVVDFNEDGHLDLFSVNHKFRSALLAGNGSRFRDVTEQLNGDPDPELSGLEGLVEPSMQDPGVYLYMTDSSEHEPGLLHIRTVGVPSRGKIAFLATRLKVIRADRAKLKLGRNHQSVVEVRFDAEPGASIVLDPSSVSDVPMAAFFDDPSDPEEIRVGSDAVAPPATDFRLTLRDRHGFAFADLGGNPSIDAFVVSGGLGGGITQPAFRSHLADELLIGAEGGFLQADMRESFRKGGCRGREAEVVDLNGDGTLDLFESCEGRRPRLYRQGERGEFHKVAAPPATGTVNRWADLGRGREPALLSGGRGEVTVWRRRGGNWEESQELAVGTPGNVVQLALGDQDGDRDLDVLAVSPGGNTLLRNDDGRLHALAAGFEGVPATSVAASFVDYDDDGATDLYTVPQGLFRREGGRYVRTGLLATPPAGAGISNWADFDGDGLRDPVIAYGKGEFAPRMQLRRARNVTPIHGHWLEVDLTGPPGNRQAVGAWVEARTGRASQVQWVGQNDDAPHSQGHYRLYFGLGLHPQLDSLTVHWPDGDEQTIPDVPADRFVEIAQQP